MVFRFDLGDFRVREFQRVVLPVVVIAKLTNFKRGANWLKKRVHTRYGLVDIRLCGCEIAQAVSENMGDDGKFFIQTRQRLMLKLVAALGIQAARYASQEA